MPCFQIELDPHLIPIMEWAEENEYDVNRVVLGWKLLSLWRLGDDEIDRQHRDIVYFERVFRAWRSCNGHSR